MEWLNQSLVVGFRTEYRLIDVHSEQQMQVCAVLQLLVCGRCLRVYHPPPRPTAVRVVAVVL